MKIFNDIRKEKIRRRFQSFKNKYRKPYFKIMYFLRLKKPSWIKLADGYTDSNINGYTLNVRESKQKSYADLHYSQY